ncbi:MAG: Cache 3/Cache 2 fusion domain-containing protein [Ruminococcus sp.]|jgi:sigma-B regulation protein RsbU (phosphoserine phosphatase)|nr:Cache 3/Cache 2 fusion domain-containing protein [Ruminococcus sp.]
MFKKNRFKIFAITTAISLIPLIALCVTSGILLSGVKNSAGPDSKLGTTASNAGAEALSAQIESDLVIRARYITESIDAKLLQIENNTREVAAYTEKLYANPENYKERPLYYLEPGEDGILVPHIRTAGGINYEELLPEILLLGNAADVLDEYIVSGINVSASYIGTESGLFVLVDSNASLTNNREYDARTRSWYIGAKESGNLFWTDIFADASGRGASVSCAMPIYGPDGEFLAVAGTGAMMTQISETVTSAEIGEEGYAFLLNNRGEVVISPKNNAIADPTGTLIGESYIMSSMEDKRTLADEMMNGRTGVLKLTLDGSDVYVAYAPLSRTDWSVGVVMPAAEVSKPVTAMQEEINVLISESETAAADYKSTAVIVIAFTAVAAFILAAALAWRFSKTISIQTEDDDDGGENRDEDE